MEKCIFANNITSHISHILLHQEVTVNENIRNLLPQNFLGPKSAYLGTEYRHNRQFVEIYIEFTVYFTIL